MADRPSEDEAILKLFERLARTTNAGDLGEWSKLWDEHARHYPPQSPMLVGRAHIILGNRKHLLEWKHEMRIDCDDIRVAGNWALVDGITSLKSKHCADGTTAYCDEKFLAVLVKNGEQWLLYRFCHNSNVPPKERVR